MPLLSCAAHQHCMSALANGCSPAMQCCHVQGITLRSVRAGDDAQKKMYLASAACIRPSVLVAALHFSRISCCPSTWLPEEVLISHPFAKHTPQHLYMDGMKVPCKRMPAQDASAGASHHRSMTHSALYGFLGHSRAQWPSSLQRWHLPSS